MFHRSILFRRSIIRLSVLGSGRGGGAVSHNRSGCYPSLVTIYSRRGSEGFPLGYQQGVEAIVIHGFLWLRMDYRGSSNVGGSVSLACSPLIWGVWLFSTLVGPPPMPLVLPSEARFPRPLPPELPFADPLVPPLIPPLHRRRILKCGSWWSPFSIPVRSAWMIGLPDKIYSSAKGGRWSCEE